MAAFPPDLDTVIEKAWQLTQRTAGFLGENEARFLGMLAACVPARGAIVEIGSFKGKSTVMLASVAAHYGLGPVVAIDPHTSPSTTDPGIAASSSTFEEFLAAVKAAGLTEHVEAHRAFSRDVAKGWNRPIRLLWIDGDHTFRGAKEDFDLFAPHVVKDGVVALHDALNAFEGPIRIFVEEILRSDQFGAAGVVQSPPGDSCGPRMAGIFENCGCESSGARAGCCRFWRMECAFKDSQKWHTSWHGRGFRARPFRRKNGPR